jgi:nitrogen fixation NifU-like protein
MDLDDLYQEVILDHKRHPRNFGPMPDANRNVDGFNPLCGDHIHLHVKLSGDVIEDVRFEGEGCAISTASASLMTEALKGKRVEDAERMFEAVHALLTEEDADPDLAHLGKLAIFSGVRQFPSRVKCASLAWHTLSAAIQEEGGEVVTTE